MIPMLVESAIGTINDGGTPVNFDAIDWLDLNWSECRKRFGQKRTRGGAEVRLLLRLRQTLKHGDVLGYWHDGRPVVVNLLPANVLVIRCDSRSDAITAAFQIGNLHLPIEVKQDAVFVPANAEAEAMLCKFEMRFERQSHHFQPTHWPDLIQLSKDFCVVQDQTSTRKRGDAQGATYSHQSTSAEPEPLA
jgi:urease accessory protein UreE